MNKDILKKVSLGVIATSLLCAKTNTSVLATETVQDENGSKYAATASALNGIVDGYYYKNGKIVKNAQNVYIDGLFYDSDSNGKAYVTRGWRNNNTNYYVAGNLLKNKTKVRIADILYNFDKDGKAEKATAWYLTVYYYENGELVKSQEKVIDNKLYTFNENGKASLVNNTWKDGKFYQDGEIVKDKDIIIKDENNNTTTLYHFDSNGKAEAYTGWGIDHKYYNKGELQTTKRTQMEIEGTKWNITAKGIGYTMKVEKVSDLVDGKAKYKVIINYKNGNKEEKDEFEMEMTEKYAKKERLTKADEKEYINKKNTTKYTVVTIKKPATSNPVEIQSVDEGWNIDGAPRITRYISDKKIILNVRDGSGLNSNNIKVYKYNNNEKVELKDKNNISMVLNRVNYNYYLGYTVILKESILKDEQNKFIIEVVDEAGNSTSQEFFVNNSNGTYSTNFAPTYASFGVRNEKTLQLVTKNGGTITSFGIKDLNSSYNTVVKTIEPNKVFTADFSKFEPKDGKYKVEIYGVDKQGLKTSKVVTFKKKSENGNENNNENENSQSTKISIPTTSLTTKENEAIIIMKAPKGIKKSSVKIVSENGTKEIDSNYVKIESVNSNEVKYTIKAEAFQDGSNEIAISLTDNDETYIYRKAKIVKSKDGNLKRNTAPRLSNLKVDNGNATFNVTDGSKIKAIGVYDANNENKEVLKVRNVDKKHTVTIKDLKNTLKVVDEKCKIRVEMVDENGIAAKTIVAFKVK